MIELIIWTAILLTIFYFVSKYNKGKSCEVCGSEMVWGSYNKWECERCIDRNRKQRYIKGGGRKIMNDKKNLEGYKKLRRRVPGIK